MRPTLRWPRALRLPKLQKRMRLPRPFVGHPRRTHSVLAGLALVLLWWGFGGAETQRWPREQILAAIRFVESGDRDVVPDGDGGLAIGPYQIHRIYWQDAVGFRPALGGDYQHCRQRDYAERVIDAYMSKWIPDAWAAGEAEAIARVHNGGPRGRENRKTDGYWQKVRARLP